MGEGARGVPDSFYNVKHVLLSIKKRNLVDR
ncbi:MAG: hypothetical protein RLY58_946 [Pseudomonadota bacterium]|jgi:hypothetical protein